MKSPRSLLTLIAFAILTAFLCGGCYETRAATNPQAPKDVTAVSHPDVLIIVATNSSAATTVDYSVRIRIKEKDENSFEKQLETIDGIISVNIFDKGYTISVRRNPAFTKDEVERNVIEALMEYFGAKKVVMFDSSTDTRMNIENQINKMIIH